MAASPGGRGPWHNAGLALFISFFVVHNVHSLPIVGDLSISNDESVSAFIEVTGRTTLLPFNLDLVQRRMDE